MTRLIKRYGGGSRKLYDSEESRYVSLEEIAGWIREGQQLRIVDSKTGEDVTAPTLTQVIYEEQKRGIPFLTEEFLHEIIRRGGKVVSEQVEQFQAGVDTLVRRLPPVQKARNEMDALRHSLEQLKQSLNQLNETPARSRKAS
jgi:polyhydroxyalkanoate synthesis repressor PhaR